MAEVFTDQAGHEVVQSVPVSLAAAAVGVVTAGSIAGTTSAGAAPTVTAVNATDRRGTFSLNPVTGGGAQAAGTVATVRFAQPYPAIPASVIVTAVNATDTTATATMSANNVTAAGFDIVSTILTTAKAYVVNYLVTP